MKILTVGPFKDFSGYSHAGRNFVKGLNLAGADIAMRHIKYDDYDGELDDVEKDLFKKPIRDCDVIIQMTTPNEIRYTPGKMNIAWMFWETSRIPEYWVNQLNMMDMVIVPCRFNAAALVRSGVTKPVCVCHPIFDMKVYDKNYSKLTIPDSDGKIVYYNICQVSAKKGLDVLLKSYFRAFIDIPDESLLVLKVYFSMVNRQNEINIVKQMIQNVRQSMRIPSRYPSVYVVTDILSDENIYRLHTAGDVYVCSSRGEGWGIPVFESMALGKNVISNAWGGMADFVTQENCVTYGGLQSIVSSQNHSDPFLYTALEDWFEPNDSQLMVAMRNVHEVLKARGHNLEDRKNKLNGLRERAKSDTRRFDLRIGGPKIYSELIKYYNSWKQHGMVKEISNETSAI